MSANYVINAEAGHINLSPHGFRKWARQFKLCRNLFLSHDPGFSPVPYFLNCRAIELEFKARHLETQNQREVKDKYGHNLERSYQHLPNNQRSLTPAELKILQAANNIYKGKGFEYFSVSNAMSAYKGFPDLGALDALTNKLVPT